MSGCVFCQIIETGAYAHDFGEVVAFEPRHPVTPGHTLFVPREHVPSALSRPLITAETMRAASEWAFDHAGPCNLITSVGEAATQTVLHLHIHFVPRRLGDGLALPWTGQVRERAS